MTVKGESIIVTPYPGISLTVVTGEPQGLYMPISSLYISMAYTLIGSHFVKTILTSDSDTVSTYQVSSVQLVTNKKLEAFNKA